MVLPQNRGTLIGNVFHNPSEQIWQEVRDYSPIVSLDPPLQFIIHTISGLYFLSRSACTHKANSTWIILKIKSKSISISRKIEFVQILPLLAKNLIPLALGFVNL